MKLSRLIITLTLILTFGSCAKDEMFDQSKNVPELKKAKVAIPFKADLCAVPDLESSLILIPVPGLDPEDPASYDNSRMIISGNASHMGSIDSEKSFYVVETFEMILEDEVPFLYQTGYGQLVAANGDSFDYTWWVKTSLASLTILDFIGGMEIISGTGNFEGCSGSADMIGKADNVTKRNCWTLEGTMEFNSADAKLKIAVISDIHYMDHSLLPVVPEENADFQNLLFNSYNKLVKLSEPIFLETVSELKNEKPDVLLIPGDMSFNGELVNHEIVKAKLQKLADAGTQILVVPGNNDINSPDAMSYAGTGSTSVANITPEDFVSIYGNFGYNDALYRDENSLSYVYQLRDNLWILGIDACIYTPAYKRGGAINANTMIWIQEKMAEANKKEITVLAMMHHGIAEHYIGQSTLFKGDVVNNFNSVSTSLMDAGIRFIFTGHSHANDIVEVAGNGKSILDIETGSLITPLSPYRILTIDDNYIRVDTKRIKKIDASVPGSDSFLAYSNSYLAEHLDLFFTRYLVNVYKLPVDLAEPTIPYLRNSIMAQYAGDEKLLPKEAQKLEELNELFPPGNQIVPMIYSLWTDLPPYDDKLCFEIK